MSFLKLVVLIYHSRCRRPTVALAHRAMFDAMKHLLLIADPKVIRSVVRRDFAFSVGLWRLSGNCGINLARQRHCFGRERQIQTRCEQF